MWLNKQYHFDQVGNFNFKRDQILQIISRPLNKKRPQIFIVALNSPFTNNTIILYGTSVNLIVDV